MHVELPTIFCNIDDEGNVTRENLIFVRNKPFTVDIKENTLETWMHKLDEITNDGAARAYKFDPVWKDALWSWANSSSKVAFCTVNLMRDDVTHCVVLLFWKLYNKLEIFDARGSDIGTYLSFPNFYSPKSLRRFCKSILREWQLVHRMIRRQLPNMDYMENVPKQFLLNP